MPTGEGWQLGVQGEQETQARGWSQEESLPRPSAQREQKGSHSVLPLLSDDFSHSHFWSAMVAESRQQGMGNGR